jgi:TolB protein
VPGQRAQAKDSTLHIDIYGPGQKEVNVFVATPRPLASGANNQTSTPQSVLTLNELLINNFGFLPFLEQVANDDILGKNDCEGIISSDIDFKRFKLSQVDLLVTCGWKIKDGNRPHVELRVFDVFTQKLLLGRGYLIPKEEQMYRVANRFCAGLMDTLTGKSGFFTSEIAFVKKSHQNKEIFISTPQGYERRQLTSFQEICLSPAWSWDASSLAFTYVNKDKHELVLWNRATKKLQHIYLPGNTIISPAFRPGNSLAISVDPNGNPDIYLLDSKWHLDRHIIQNWAIDISPDFDRTGKNMVFVSSRLGNPHIFLNDMDTEEVSRISYEGTYNTNPSISPNGRYVAYSRLTDTGHRIIVYDRKKDVEQQITFGPGDDEDPAWCPDSYFLAFASSRSGAYQLYVTTRQGEFLRKIPTGSGVAKSPAWSPVLSAE